MPETDINVAASELAELVRKEVLELMVSGKTWKLIISGNVGGDVRTVVELHGEALRRFVPISRSSPER